MSDTVRLSVKNFDDRDFPVLLGYIASGKSLRSWCRDRNIDVSHLYTWMVDSGNRPQFDLAMMTRADSAADEIDDLANELLTKYEENPKAGAAMANVYRTTIQAKQWTAAMLNPKRFGQLLQVNQTNEYVQPDKVKQRIDELEKKMGLKVVK